MLSKDDNIDTLVAFCWMCGKSYKNHSKLQNSALCLETYDSLLVIPKTILPDVLDNVTAYPMSAAH